MNQAALDGVRILDLTSEMGRYCGKLPTDRGAEVLEEMVPEAVEV